MKRFAFGFLLVAAVACGGSESDIGVTDPPPGKKALDPFLTIRVRNQLDTTKAPGRAAWTIYALLSGPYTNQNGISHQADNSLADIRRGLGVRCMGAGADSVGQRLFSVLAIADTTTEDYPLSVTVNALAIQWYDGNHTLPAGWMAIVFPPADLWDSQQFTNGHGLVKSDPVKWGFDWTDAGSTSLYERSDADPTCAIFP